MSNLGVVMAIAGGEADIRATFEGVTGSLHVRANIALTAFQRDYIEAIFLGSGPLSPADGNHACSTISGTWTGFPRSTIVRVRVSTTVSSDKRAAIEGAAAQVNEATNGVIQTTFESTDDPNPIPAVRKATCTTHPSPATQGCTSDNGCTIHAFAGLGVLASSRAVQPANQTPNAYAHDVIGHGVIGMCHVDGVRIGGAALSLMSGGPGVSSGQIASQLTLLDIAAAQAVYKSGLNPGANRRAFIDAGLVNGSAASTSRGRH